MADLAYILIAIAFFALCAGYVGFADRIIERSDPEPAGQVAETGEVTR